MTDSDGPIGLHATGSISAEVALARLILDGFDPDSLPDRIRNAGNPELARIAAERQTGLRQLRALLDLSGLDHTPAEAGAALALTTIRAGFDRAVALSPEASVAAYSLGDTALLAAATDEIIAWLAAMDLIGPDSDVLDFGCGIGRVAAALAPRVRSVVGLDLSPGMIAEAQRRSGARNLRFATTAGEDLAEQPDAAFDLVLAVDSLPYVVQAGPECAGRHMADFARILRRGGALAVLNLSYRDPAHDREDARAWAALHGLALVQAGTAPFALWDGRAFLWLRHA